LRVIIILLFLIPYPQVTAQNHDVISPRAASRMVLDSENNQILLFGGYTVGETRDYYEDTWVFSPLDNTWTQLIIDGPSPRGAHSMAYSPDQGTILLFGGQSSNNRLGDTWIFDCRSETWTQIETEIAPEGRSDSDLAYDSVQKVFILYGGWGDKSGLQSDTWMFDSETKVWSQYETDINPGKMYGQSLEYDAERERVILYGGHLRSPISHDYIEDIWFFYPENSSWSQSSFINKPHGRYWNAAAYSAEDSALVVFGGSYGEGALNETWLFNIDMMSWTRLESAVFPSRRVISDMVYVESLGFFILFGGGGLIDNSYLQYNDTWKLDTETWTWSQIQASYSTREKIQVTEESNISGYSNPVILTGIGLIILIKRRKSLFKLRNQSR
jgi:N-acetylneuraminic acid mutarotase